MVNLSFEVPFGDEMVLIEVSEVVSGSGGYHIYTNRYYNGQVVKINNNWVHHLNERSQLSLEDIQVIYEMIDKAKK